jgi:hypothetical protein
MEEGSHSEKRRKNMHGEASKETRSLHAWKQKKTLTISTTVPPFSLHRISLLKNIAATQMRWETYS